MKNDLSVIMLIFICSCGIMKNDCVKAIDIEKKSTEFLISKADSISKVIKSSWKEKVELEKQGIISDISYDSNIYFNQNCYTTDKLEFVYYVIGMMINNEILKIKVIGHIDVYELKNNPELSLKRAEFIQSIMIKSGIDKKRIEIFDVKSERPNAQQSEIGEKENRRVDFEIINK